MKTAIYIEDGDVQVVLTPESEWERSALKTLGHDAIDARRFNGSFYQCQGGWHRQGTWNYSEPRDDASLILRVQRSAGSAPSA